MFTGIVEEVGTVTAYREVAAGIQLVIHAGLVLETLRPSESIAVNGTCLTAVGVGNGTFSADCSPETLRCTTLGDLRAGSQVHLERPLAADGRLGGHFVQGHVDGTGRVLWQRTEGESLVVAYWAPPEVTPYLVPKGSVAVDGVSLTIIECTGAQFTVALIPHTLAVTRLGKLTAGHRVNLEADMLAKYVAKALEVQQTGTAQDPAT
ncbi:MAG: riboflavin synthase [Dehalococcoidia bacterium]|nr:riboflavin synthase [Dehalococcoidia bacterium]